MQAESAQQLLATEQGQQDLLLLHQCLGNEDVECLIKEKLTPPDDVKILLKFNYLNYSITLPNNVQ